jgi:hypothetical protein
MVNSTASHYASFGGIFGLRKQSFTVGSLSAAAMPTAPRDGVFAPSTNDSKRMVWKVIRSLKFLSQFALVALPLSLSSGLAKAQTAYEAKFTLPFEAHWGIAVLPAGDYTISLSCVRPGW